jgi:hypothetical protein
MMNQQPFNAQTAAAVLRGLAGEFQSIQAIDPNEAGFVVRIRALQIQAAEQTIAALNASAFNGQPWEPRLRELAAPYNAAAASQALSREQRVSLLRDFWWDLTGNCRAKCEGVVVGGKPRLGRVVEIGPPPAILSPFAEPELAILGLEQPAEFAAEAARSARLHAAFVCSTMADILAKAKDPLRSTDDTAVTAQQLAVHANVGDAAVRKRLRDCPSVTGRGGENQWRYCDVVEVLRSWCRGQDASNRMKKKGIEWPQLAKNLKSPKGGTQKK